jgi:Tol biopolymer transport system component
MRRGRAIALETALSFPFARYGWSSDSRKLAVITASRMGGVALSIVHRDGSHLRRVACRCPFPLSELAWSRRGPIAYTDAHRLYTVAPTGGDARRLAGAAACTYSATTPAVSPDGGTVLFVCDRRIVSVDLRTAGRRTLFNARRLPHPCSPGSPTPFTALAWSPDARSIAVADRCSIVAMRADGSHPHRLPRVPSLASVTELTWAGVRPRPAVGEASAAVPGGLIAFESSDEPREIVTMHPDGTGLRVLVRNGSEPAWSPDGRWLAYTRASQTPSPYIARTRSDGTGTQRVSRFPATAGAHPSMPSWAPDGRHVVFNAEYLVRDHGETRYDLGVFIARRNGSRPRKVRANTSRTGPAWSPDGRHIALVTPRGRVGVIPAAGGHLRMLGRIPHTYSKLAFSPDGKRLLVLAGSAISTFNARTGRQTEIRLAEGEALRSATWTPRGNRIAYMAQVGPQGSQTALFTIRQDGSGKRRLATVPTPVQGETLSWRADARTR